MNTIVPDKKDHSHSGILWDPVGSIPPPSPLTPTRTSPLVPTKSVVWHNKKLKFTLSIDGRVRNGTWRDQR